MGLDAEARINHPSTLGSNWKWRMNSEMISKELSDKIYALTKISARLSESCQHKEKLKIQELKAKEEAEKKKEK